MRTRLGPDRDILLRVFWEFLDFGLFLCCRFRWRERTRKIDRFWCNVLVLGWNKLDWFCTEPTKARMQIDDGWGRTPSDSWICHSSVWSYFGKTLLWREIWKDLELRGWLAGFAAREAARQIIENISALASSLQRLRRIQTHRCLSSRTIRQLY